MVDGERAEIFSLVGVVGQVVGGTDSFRILRPVVEDSAGARFAALRDEWTTQDLSPVRPHEDGFWLRTRFEVHEPVQPGQVVLLMGPEFSGRLENYDELRAVRRDVRRWRLAWNGYAVHSAPPAVYQELCTEIFSLLLPRFYRSLAGGDERQGDSTRIFKILTQLTGVPTADLLIVRALYHHEVYNLDAFRLVSAQAVALGVAKSEEEFWEQIEERVNWVKRDRLARISSSGQQAVEVAGFFDKQFRDPQLMEEALTTGFLPGTLPSYGEWLTPKYRFAELLRDIEAKRSQ